MFLGNDLAREDEQSFYLLYKRPGAEAKDLTILLQVINEEKHFGHAAPLLAAHFPTPEEAARR